MCREIQIDRAVYEHWIFLYIIEPGAKTMEGGGVYTKILITWCCFSLRNAMNSEDVIQDPVGDGVEKGSAEEIEVGDVPKTSLTTHLEKRRS